METLQQNCFVPLNHDEMENTFGGIPPVVIALLAAVAGAAVAEILDDWDNFKAGLLGKPEIKN